MMRAIVKSLFGRTVPGALESSAKYRRFIRRGNENAWEKIKSRHYGEGEWKVR
jgi:hypothetical protein